MRYGRSYRSGQPTRVCSLARRPESSAQVAALAAAAALRIVSVIGLSTPSRLLTWGGALRVWGRMVGGRSGGEESVRVGCQRKGRRSVSAGALVGRGLAV